MHVSCLPLRGGIDVQSPRSHHRNHHRPSDRSLERYRGARPDDETWDLATTSGGSRRHENGSRHFQQGRSRRSHKDASSYQDREDCLSEVSEDQGGSHEGWHRRLVATSPDLGAYNTHRGRGNRRIR